MPSDATVRLQIEQCVDLLKQVLGADLSAIYLYGSSTIGGLQRYSDIDLFAVAARPTIRDEKAALAAALNGISGPYRSAERRPVEITIVAMPELHPWRYPPSFDFQYGDWLRKEFESGNLEPWHTRARPDLALLITQVTLASRTLYGEPPGRLLPAVPYADFMRALTDEMEGLRADLDTDTRNVLLTLARIWRTVETNTIGSKQGAARWAIARLAAPEAAPLQRALDSTIGSADDSWDGLLPQAAASADVIMAKIRGRSPANPATNATNAISLAD